MARITPKYTPEDRERIVEAMARAMWECVGLGAWPPVLKWKADSFRDEASAALDAALSAGLADAIRATALEDAAKVARDEAYGFPESDMTEHGQGYNRACKEIAAAILALREKEIGK